MSYVEHNPIVITAFNMIKANCPKLLVPHLDNFYEQWLYEHAEKVTGISHYYASHFKDASFKGHLDAVENCFDGLMKNAALHRKINKKRSSRIGVIYFDQYGPVSFFNKDAQIKEMYYSDVFPSFILNSHNISGYSIRLRAERCALFQALETAQTLIKNGELDMVIVGGVHQCIPYLYLTDVVDDYHWIKNNSGLIGDQASSLYMADATGFLLLESSDHAKQRSVEILAELSSLKCKTKHENDGSRVNAAFSYPFARTLANELPQDEDFNSIDMGCMTVFDVLAQSIDDQHEAEQISIVASDRDNYSWSLQLSL